MSEGRFDFEAHEVLRVVQSALARGLMHREPFTADDYQERIGLRERSIDLAREILPRRNVLHVPPDPLLAEAGFEGIRQPACLAGAVVTTVADEDARHDRGTLV